MTSVEKRFLTGFRSEDADTPGLVQEDDGTVWLIAPDGTRTQISGGGSMPATWTENPDGSVTIVPSDPAVGAIRITPPTGATDDDTDLLRIDDDSGTERVYVTADGLLGIKGGFSVLLAARNSNGTWRADTVSGGFRTRDGDDVFIVGGGGVSVVASNPRAENFVFLAKTSTNDEAFRVKDDGGIDLPMLPTVDPAVEGRLWNDAGTLKVSAG